MNGDRRLCLTKGCPTFFVQRSNGQKFCDDCAKKRFLQCPIGAPAPNRRPTPEVCRTWLGDRPHLQTKPLGTSASPACIGWRRAVFDCRDALREP